LPASEKARVQMHPGLFSVYLKNQKEHVKGLFHATTRRRNENQSFDPDSKTLRRCGVA
jgi:hypothetical protein